MDGWMDGWMDTLYPLTCPYSEKSHGFGSDERENIRAMLTIVTKNL